MTVDDIITKITNAPSEREAKAILRSVPSKMLAVIADQLHIDTWGHGDTWTRNEILLETRS